MVKRLGILFIEGRRYLFSPQFLFSDLEIKPGKEGSVATTVKLITKSPH